MTPSAKGHNLYPEIVFDPEPGVMWYTARDTEFFLVGERFIRDERRWEELKLDNLERLPAAPLPCLARRPSGSLAAFWPDRPELGADAASADRVFVGEQNKETQGEGTIVDRSPSSAKRHVYGTAAGNLLYLTWCAESGDNRNEVVVGVGKTPDSITQYDVTDGGTSHYANPRLAPAGTAKCSVVWESSLSEGGDGSIYYRQVTVK